jgi:hypothetical protein
MEVAASELKKAVESQHGGTATFIQAVPVHETFRDQTVWEGMVLIFDLRDSPSGVTRAYAWSHAIDGTERRRFFAVLHIPPIDSPVNAVRAAIVAEARAK